VAIQTPNPKKAMKKTPTPEDATLIDAYRLSRIVGLTERRLRQMANEGILPEARRNRYPLAATLQALLKYYRDRHDNDPLRDTYPSFEACSKALGIPLKVLNQAKELGCPALRQGRVKLGPFLLWYHGEQGREPISLEAEQARFVALQNERLKLMVGQLTGEYVTAEAVRHLGATLGRAIRKVLLTTHLLAPSLAGLPAEKIEQYLKDQEEAILAQLEILDRTFKAWKDLADNAEKTLGGLQPEEIFVSSSPD
jgi:phage terminase Nu1 subunit (DNA packaging protein)